MSQLERPMPEPALTPPPHGNAASDPIDARGLPAPVTLADAERETLLALARAALAVAVGAAPRSALDAALADHPPVERRAAAFVTLTEHGELRGCIGHMDAGAPVQASVVEAATWAALEDPRFAPVRPSELRDIDVEVSVLGPLLPLADPMTFRLGTDGIVVQRGGRRGLLLPEVAAMLSNDRVAMLDTACRKAGLPSGAWRDQGTVTFAFRTDRFGGRAVAESAEA